MSGKLYLRHIAAGTELIRQGEQDAMLIFVVTGSLQVLQQMVGHEKQEVTSPFYFIFCIFIQHMNSDHNKITVCEVIEEKRFLK